MKLIPAIDIRDGKCVRLQQGDFERQTTYDVRPVEMAKKWEALGAPIIHIVDLDGAKAGVSHNLSTIVDICRSIECPCQLGGGIRKIEDVKKALDAGVSRVILGTAITSNPEFASELLSHFNPGQIIAGLDGRDGKVATEGWLKDSSQSVEGLAQTLFEKGIQRFIYTDISTDGMFTGPNYEDLKSLCEHIPEASIIASGGVGSTDHIRQLNAISTPNLEGIIIGKALYDGRVSYEDLVRSANS